MRSSIVDKVVTELNGSGQRTSTFVYLENQMLARYSGGVVWWEHYNPVSQSVVESNSSGAAVQLSERDPMGGNAGLESPYEETWQPEFSFEYYQSPNDVGLGNPTNPRSGCNLEGMSVPCERVAALLMNGAADLDPSQPQGSGPLGMGGIVQQQTDFIRGDRPHTGEVYLENRFESLMSSNLEFFQRQQNPGTKAALNKNDAKRYEQERLAALGRLAFSPGCRDFLSKHGIDVKALIDAVKNQRPFDGKKSTLTRGEAGVVDPNNPHDLKYTNVLLRESFGSRGSSGAETAIWPGGALGKTVVDRSDVYFRSSSIKTATILHEALHSLLGETDPQLQRRLGIEVGKPSSNISQKLKDEGCAEQE